MKLKQQVELTIDEVLNIAKKIVENKTKKKVIEVKTIEPVIKEKNIPTIYSFILEDGTIEEPQQVQK